ncbi:MAG: hypothetical protein ACM359_12585 [Bacillota bacterium]
MTTMTMECRERPPAAPAMEAWLGSPLLPLQREEVRAVSLSKNDVTFQLMRPLSVGTREVLEVGLGDQRLVASIQVKRCRPAERGAWEIRATFC